MHFVLKNYFVRKFDIILEERSVAIFPISHSPHLGKSSFLISGVSEFTLFLTLLKERNHPYSKTVRLKLFLKYYSNIFIRN
jgi:hypothetical protein